MDLPKVWVSEPFNALRKTDKNAIIGKLCARVSPPQSLSGPMRDTPPYRAIPFRDSIAEGGIAPICLFSCGIAQVSLRYPFCGGGGVRTSISRMLSKP